MIENITKLPLVIVSSPRTGSNALAMLLQKNLNGSLFIEPGVDSKKLNNFYRYALMKNDYILKEHAETLLLKYKNFNFNTCCVVRISRQNFIEQLVSSYITTKRKKWFYDKDETHYSDETIEMDEDHLKEHIKYLQRQNSLTEQFKDKIDFDLVYEDIVDKLQFGIKTIQPKNYTDLLVWAKETCGKT